MKATKKYVVKDFETQSYITCFEQGFGYNTRKFDTAENAEAFISEIQGVFQIELVYCIEK